MSAAGPDSRSLRRRTRDQAIAAEPQLAPLDLPQDANPLPMETHLGQLVHPRAIAGIVENGVVRPLDPGVKLPEHARVIIIATETP